MNTWKTLKSAYMMTVKLEFNNSTKQYRVKRFSKYTYIGDNPFNAEKEYKKACSLTGLWGFKM